MTDHQSIMAAYLECETAARAKVHGILMPEDVVACITATAARLGIERVALANVVRADASGMWG